MLSVAHDLLRDLDDFIHVKVALLGSHEGREEGLVKELEHRDGVKKEGLEKGDQLVPHCRQFLI